jgi:hypothetical protein
MVRPSALAVLRLITSSNLVGRTTGRSAGAAGGRSFGDGHKQSFPGRAPEQFNCIGPCVSVVLFLLPKTPQPSELDFGEFSKRRMREMSQNIGVHRIFSGSRARPGPCENSRRHQKYL